MELTTCDTVRDITQGQALLSTQALLTLQLLTLVGDFASLLLCLDYVELVTCSRRTVQTEDDSWLSWSSRLDIGITLIEHRLDTTPRSTGEYDVAYLQGTIGNQYGRNISTTLVERRLDDGTCSTTVRVSLQVEHVSLEEHLVEQIVNTDTLLGTDFLALILTTPLLNEQVHVSQVLTDTVWVSTWLINLVDSEYHWYTGSLRMSDSLLGSWHHRVIGCDDDDGDIGSLGTTGTHGGKRLVTWSIKEGYLATAFQGHTIGTDMLGNTTRLTGNHIGIADIVEQRGLTVVYVTHDGYDWSTWNQVVLIIHFLAHGLLNLGTHVFGLETELLSYHVDGLCIQALVDRNHDTYTHQGRDNLSNADIHHRSQLANSNELSKFQGLAFLLLLTSLILQLLLNSLTLLLTVLSTLLVLTLAGQTCKSLLNLACYSLVINLNLALVAAVVVIAAIIIVIISIAVFVLLVITAVVAITSAIILSFGIDVNTFFVDTNTLFALIVLLSHFLLTFLAALLLGFLLRTSALVERRQIYLAQHLRLISSKLLLTLESKHAVVCCASRMLCSFILSMMMLFLSLRSILLIHLSV